MSMNKIANYKIPHIKEITENKVQWNIEKENVVLLIHDMQVYFTDAYDKEGEPYQTMVKNIKIIKEECRKNRIPVVYSAQPGGQTKEQRGLLLDFWGEGIPQGEGKEEIINELEPDKDNIVITKWRYSAFKNTELEDLMKKWHKNQMIITGIYAHIGCLTTSLAASMKGIKLFMISDAVGDFTREKHKMALEYVSQLSGMVMSTQQFIDKL